MDAALEDWFARRTWQQPTWTVDELRAAKFERTVSVVLPALNEQDTVGPIVTAILPLTTGSKPLVDELVVLDSGSTDATAERAAAAGARVVHREDVLAGTEPVPGKGEVLWRSLAATTGDLVVFLDSDLVDFDPGFVPALLGPLLTSTDIALVKGFYRRPLRLESSELDTGGGRVTELLARPLLAALRPELSGIVQPLGGEYAATRDLLESVPFAAGYGVEIGLLLDTHARLGLNALAQVNLGVRKHRNRSLLQLGVMARQILSAALHRCGPADQGFDHGGGTGEAAGDTGQITQFRQLAGEWLPTTQQVTVTERPPMREVREELDGARR
ncbi:MAG TPA: glucosyl-3-phosphoglycerate synthase [Pseudonocardia sp.]|jgi:glucosyl-3-phosphoglycerate synthase|nr:glucosyl-3-phosphoglycerate synthase [Pseudonocardia sp.]